MGQVQVVRRIAAPAATDWAAQRTGLETGILAAVAARTEGAGHG